MTCWNDHDAPREDDLHSFLSVYWDHLERLQLQKPVVLVHCRLTEQCLLLMSFSSRTIITIDYLFQCGYWQNRNVYCYRLIVTTNSCFPRVGKWEKKSEKRWFMECSRFNVGYLWIGVVAEVAAGTYGSNRRKSFTNSYILFRNNMFSYTHSLNFSWIEMRQTVRFLI